MIACRVHDGALEALLVPPGGSTWKRKDGGGGSIPKRGVGDGRDPLAARREIEQETGVAIVRRAAAMPLA